MSEKTDATGEDFTIEELRQKRHAGAARLLLMVMKGDFDDMAPVALKQTLTDEERAWLGELILSTFPADQAEQLCRNWFRGQGAPGASFADSPVADARFWAQGANSKELDAYAMACVKEMSEKRRRQFSQWLAKQLEAVK